MKVLTFKLRFIFTSVIVALFQANSVLAEKSTSRVNIKNPTLLESTWIMPQVSIFMPSELTLSSPTFNVAYGKQFPSLTQAGFAALTPLFNWGGVRILSSTKVGFSYKAGLLEINPSNGAKITESMRLYWVPLSLGAKFIYTLPHFPFIKPSLTLGGGAHWFYQTGPLSGANQSFWVPYYYFTPALSFLEGTAPTDWFGGFTFGVTYQSSLSSIQNISGVSFDMGINILL
jgi:hypothetical protein